MSHGRKRVGQTRRGAVSTRRCLLYLAFPSSSVLTHDRETSTNVTGGKLSRIVSTFTGVNRLLILCMVTLFLIVISDIVTRGMMPDGTLYAAIARDLANGSGSFWAPPTFLPTGSFHDHPPLGLFLQSLLFRLLGDHFWVENLYAAITLCVAVYLMHRIQIGCGVKASSYGVLMFLICPLVAFTYTNNFLENTVVVFGLASLLAALASIS